MNKFLRDGFRMFESIRHCDGRRRSSVNVWERRNYYCLWWQGLHFASRLDFPPTFQETLRNCVDEVECLFVYCLVVLCNSSAQI